MNMQEKMGNLFDLASLEKTAKPAGGSCPLWVAPPPVSPSVSAVVCHLEAATDWAEIALGARRGRPSNFAKSYSKTVFLEESNRAYQWALARLSK